MRRYCLIFLWIAGSAAQAQSYQPPEESKPLLGGADLPSATPLDEAYRLQFAACDKGITGVGAKDHFNGHDLRLRNTPESRQYYLCSRDPSNVTALLKLGNGGVLWQGKMALDVDGSWAAWNGIPGATDLKETSYKWPGVTPSSSRDAQLDPDRIPFVVMPMSGIRKLTGAAAPALAREFSQKTGLQLGDLGVVIYKDRWTPVMVGDGGPFMRLGEGSSRVFETIGQTRCRKWNVDRTACVGTGNNAYPYINAGLSSKVISILYPGSKMADMTKDNVMTRLCAFAKEKLGLTGQACPTP